MPDSRRYNDEEVQAIIQRALQQQGSAKVDLTHADLVGIGEQVGLSAEAIEQAALAELEARRAARATQHLSSSRRRWLAAHAALFAVINLLLFTVNALTTPGEWWFLFSLVFWGLALGAHAAFAFGASISPRRLERERARIEADAAVRASTSPQLRVADAERTSDAIESTKDESVDPKGRARS